MLGAPPAFVLSQDQTLNVDRIKTFEKTKDSNLFSEQLWRCFHRLMFLRNYFIGFLKESGFVRFAHSILFNFQVPHLRYRQTGSRRCLVDSLFILPQLFPFVKRFLKISFRGSLATACICYHSWKKMSIAKIQTGILHFFILQSKMKLFFLSNCPIEEAKGFNLVTINPKIALLFFNKG